jgi:hypothetical protein
MTIRITFLATRQEPASLEEPSGIKIGGPTTAGPALLFLNFLLGRQDFFSRQ